MPLQLIEKAPLLVYVILARFQLRTDNIPIALPQIIIGALVIVVPLVCAL